ncbi:MAG: UDP-2,3-diacylglucosamine diphosphatase [Bacteroidales bacterium]|nr:UDP-2,3-diacylglucosamine diphosphatase [Bacteroidales bacterium]MBN2755708.1 UDP-2,3-diacylglucosamine diphosphatase [Bacteroidales bacterium]
MKKSIQDKRKVEILVLSDIHLGTFGSKAKELLNYLKTVNPEILVLNGDIIDIWQFNKHYFPKTHMKVIKHFTTLLTNGTKVYYITGNHDEMLRKFKGFKIGNFEILNKLILEIDGKKAWFFHGDVFDITMKYSKWLAKLGGIGYDLLIIINTFFNYISQKLGQGRISLSKKIKNSVKRALKFVDNFEETAAEIAITNGFEYVICGHIHQPQMREITNKIENSVMYLNSGDWIENLTSLEYSDGKWKIYEYFKDQIAQNIDNNESLKEQHLSNLDLEPNQIFNELLKELQFNKQFA